MRITQAGDKEDTGEVVVESSAEKTDLDQASPAVVFGVAGLTKNKHQLHRTGRGELAEKE